MDESRQTPGPKRPARISDRVKREFVADYFDSCDSVEEVARRHGMSLAQGYETLCTGRFVDRYQDAARAVQARARLYVTMQSEKAARKQAELMERELQDHLLYIVQNAVRDILERSCVREKDEGERDIRITFDGGMPQTGMPPGAEGEAETDADGGGE